MTDYEALDHLIGKETRLLEKRIAELTQERDTALTERDKALAELDRLQEHWLRWVDRHEQQLISIDGKVSQLKKALEAE